jgi:hypothetical protein
VLTDSAGGTVTAGVRMTVPSKLGGTGSAAPPPAGTWISSCAPHLLTRPTVTPRTCCQGTWLRCRISIPGTTWGIAGAGSRQAWPCTARAAAGARARHHRDPGRPGQRAAGAAGSGGPHRADRGRAAAIDCGRVTVTVDSWRAGRKYGAILEHVSLPETAGRALVG